MNIKVFTYSHGASHVASLPFHSHPETLISLSMKFSLIKHTPYGASSIAMCTPLDSIVKATYTCSTLPLQCCATDSLPPDACRVKIKFNCMPCVFFFDVNVLVAVQDAMHSMMSQHEWFHFAVYFFSVDSETFPRKLTSSILSTTPYVTLGRKRNINKSVITIRPRVHQFACARECWDGEIVNSLRSQVQFACGRGLL